MRGLKGSKGLVSRQSEFIQSKSQSMSLTSANSQCIFPLANEPISTTGSSNSSNVI